MKNQTVKTNNGGISRRNLLKTGSAAAILAGLGPVACKKAHAGAFSSAIVDGAREEDNLCRVLAFWLAATNAHADLAQLNATKIMNATGLAFSKGNGVDKALQRIASNSATYNSIRTEFLEFTKLFAYAPGQCPKMPGTLKKMADVDPNA